MEGDNAEQSEALTLSDSSCSRVLGFTPKYRHTPKSPWPCQTQSLSTLIRYSFTFPSEIFSEYKKDTSTHQRAREKTRSLWRYEDRKIAQITLIEPSSISSPASMSPRGSKTRQGNQSLHTRIPVILSLVPEIRPFLAFIHNFLSREHLESARKCNGNERIVMESGGSVRCTYEVTIFLR